MLKDKRLIPANRTAMRSIAQRIGPSTLRERETASVASLIAFLAWKGIRSSYDNAIDIAPIPKAGATPGMIRHIAHQLGIVASQTDAVVLSARDFHPVLVQRESGYAFLILARMQDKYVVVLPGGSPNVQLMDTASGIAEGVDSFHILRQARAPGPWYKRRYPAPRLFLIPWQDTYHADYCEHAVKRLNLEFARVERPHEAHTSVDALTVDAILEANLNICRSLPQYFGRFREINLRRTSTFLDFKAIPDALAALLDVMREYDSNELPPASFTHVAARAFVDFLTIHPFVNGNRRVAIALITAFARRHGVAIDWERISRSQLYYAVRCACRGHFSQLDALFREMAMPSGAHAVAGLE